MTKKNSREAMEAVVAELFSPHNWFMFPIIFLDLLPREEAHLLAYLLSHAAMCHCSRKWFYCKMSKIMADLRMSQSAQTDTISKLKKKDYIKTKMKGLPAKRYILINWKLLYEKMEEVISKRGDEWEDEDDA